MSGRKLSLTLLVSALHYAASHQERTPGMQLPGGMVFATLMTALEEVVGDAEEVRNACAELAASGPAEPEVVPK